MKNPYPKTALDEEWADAIFVPREYKLRWAWFENFGSLWMSSRSIKARHQHPRDYIEPILDRCVRRYGYLSEVWLYNAYRHIEDKHDWYSTAHRHIPQRKKYGLLADGPFHAVDFENKEETCPYCGGNNGYLYSIMLKDPDSGDYKIFRQWNLSGYSGHHYLYSSRSNDTSFRCLDENCREVIKFVGGTHETIRKAKEIGIVRKMPVTEIKKCETAGEAFLRSAAALVDLEARYNDKLTKLNEVKNESKTTETSTRSP